MVSKLKSQVRTTGNIVNDIAALFNRIDKFGLDLQCVKLIEQILSLGEGSFGEKQANWVLKNHNKILNLLKTKNGAIVFRVLTKTLDEKSDLSISKIIKSAKVNRKFFYSYLNALKEMELVNSIEDNYKIGQSKKIVINEEYRPIIFALRLYQA